MADGVRGGRGVCISGTCRGHMLRWCYGCEAAKSAVCVTTPCCKHYLMGRGKGGAYVIMPCCKHDLVGWGGRRMCLHSLTCCKHDLVGRGGHKCHHSLLQA